MLLAYFLLPGAGYELDGATPAVATTPSASARSPHTHGSLVILKTHKHTPVVTRARDLPRRRRHRLAVSAEMVHAQVDGVQRGGDRAKAGAVGSAQHR